MDFTDQTDRLVYRSRQLRKNFGDRGWNDKLENTVKNIGETARAYKLMHLEEAQMTLLAYNRLTVLGLILGPMASVISAIEATIEPYENVVLPIISILLGFFAGIIVGIIKFGRYDERISKNKQAAAKFTSIETNVRRQLGMYRANRSPAEDYLEWLNERYEELTVASPLLPLKIYSREKRHNQKSRKSLFQEDASSLANPRKEIEIACEYHETCSDPGCARTRRSSSPPIVRPPRRAASAAGSDTFIVDTQARDIEQGGTPVDRTGDLSPPSISRPARRMGSFKRYAVPIDSVL